MQSKRHCKVPQIMYMMCRLVVIFGDQWIALHVLQIALFDLQIEQISRQCITHSYATIEVFQGEEEQNVEEVQNNVTYI